MILAGSPTRMDVDGAEISPVRSMPALTPTARSSSLPPLGGNALWNVEGPPGQAFSTRVGIALQYQIHPDAHQALATHAGGVLPIQGNSGNLLSGSNASAVDNSITPYDRNVSQKNDRNADTPGKQVLKDEVSMLRQQLSNAALQAHEEVT